MAQGLFDGGQKPEQTPKFQGLDPEILQILHNPNGNDAFMHDPVIGLDDAVIDGYLLNLLERKPPTFNPAPAPEYQHQPRQSRVQQPPKPPAGLPPSTLSEKMRAVSGLPDGPIVPDSVSRLMGDALDFGIANSARFVAGTAVVMSGTVIGTVTVGSGMALSSEAATTGSKQVAAVEQVSPRAAEVVEVAFRYTPTSSITPKQIANAMQASSKGIVAQNPGLSVDSTINPGATIGGKVRASKLVLPAPVSAQKLAEAYGLPSDAILSVNTPNEHGLLTGEVLIPGRQIVEAQGVSFEPQVIATSLQLSEVGSRELARVNQNAPNGQLILPLSDVVEQNLNEVPTIAAAAVIVDADAESGPDSSNVTSSTSPVSSTTSSTSTTVAQTTSSRPTPTSTTSIPAPAVVPSTTVPPTPETTVPAPVEQVAPEPVPVAIERAATPEEKFAADVEAIHQALDHALDTGDLGPINHLVTYSPIFKGYNLTPAQQAAGMRHLPPANLLGIEGLLYEFGQNTPDNERQGNSQLLSVLLYYAYSFRKEVQSNPEWAALFPDACARFNDLAALDGHQTHKTGRNADLNSSRVCDVSVGHSAADGPTGWVNRSASISHTITNPHYNFDLDYRLNDRLRLAQIDGVPVVSSILYNAPHMPDGVDAHENHGDHEHVTVNGAQDVTLARVAFGGGRPEQNLDNLRAQIMLTYFAGDGVQGISQNLTFTEFVSEPAGLEPMAGVAVQATPSPEVASTPEAPIVADDVLSEGAKHAFVRALLLNEIASGEGGYDSVNRGGAGDTKVGDANYKNIFGDRPLSQHTVGELMELQRKGRILAIGRYQFIEGTFESAVKALGIDPNQMFDVATQDYMAANYLIFMKRPNLVAYIKGDNSKEYLAQEDLCMEFASIPCNDGSGYYDGDGAGNGAHGGRARVAQYRILLKALQLTYLAANKEVLEELASQQPTA